MQKKRIYATLVTLFSCQAAWAADAQPSAHHLNVDVSGNRLSGAADREGSQQINAVNQLGASLKYEYDILNNLSVSVGHKFKQDHIETELLDFEDTLDLQSYVALDYEFVPSWFLASEFKVKQRYASEKVDFTDAFEYEAHAHLVNKFQVLGGHFKAELGGTYVQGLLSSKWEVNYGMTWLINDQWQLGFANTNLGLDDVTLTYKASDAWKFSANYCSASTTYLTGDHQVTNIAHDALEFAGTYKVTDHLSLGFGIDFLGDGTLSQTTQGQDAVKLAEHLDNRTKVHAKIVFNF